jgi:hypothetical protein
MAYHMACAYPDRIAGASAGCVTNQQRVQYLTRVLV